MSIDLKAIKERLAKATPGPWDRDRTEVQGPKELHLCDLRRWEDAALVAHAPADISALVAEVESLRALLREGLKGAAEFEGFCPWCLGFGGSPEEMKHEPGCSYASAIREEP